MFHLSLKSISIIKFKLHKNRLLKKKTINLLFNQTAQNRHNLKNKKYFPVSSYLETTLAYLQFTLTALLYTNSINLIRLIRVACSCGSIISFPSNDKIFELLMMGQFDLDFTKMCTNLNIDFHPTHKYPQFIPRFV